MEPTNTSAHDGDYEISSPSALVTRPTVSVVMLAYNHGKYLRQAIDGVLAQVGAFPMELLIGEDCSTDNTRELALRCQSENPGIVRVITSAANVGSLRNSHRILTASRGEFIAYLDGDDYWLAGKLAKQVDYLRTNPDCAAVYTNAIAIDEAGNRIGLFNDVGNARFDLAAMLRHGNFLNNSSMMFRAAARPGLLETTAPHIDYRTHLRLARDGYLAQLAEPLTAYRVNSETSMVASMNDKVRELYWEAIQSVPHDLVRDSDIACALADFLRRVVFRAACGRRWSLVRKWAPRVFAASPLDITTTVLFTCYSIMRTLWKESVGLLRKDADGNRLRVLYRR
jgi:glycosyltransferase involved in cell wall biosynthesis